MSQPIEISPFGGPRVNCRSTVKGIQKDFERYHRPIKSDTTPTSLDWLNETRKRRLLGKAKAYYRSRVKPSEIDLEWIIKKAVNQLEQKMNQRLKADRAAKDAPRKSGLKTKGQATQNGEDKSVVDEIAAIQLAITKNGWPHSKSDPK